ncbi:hypothetical protein NQ318_007265 [Aromia moschata]|uniref:DUF4817 domain-containing protein n=1 Tax=Aromia moschata TaxID=1265417 RepID=A0AAV8YZJ3_9CUCU|nr:hypothetical protein NQ318_007265 [Aromia moschata]
MTDMVAIYAQQNFSERAAARSYADTYPNGRQPNRKLFSRLFSRLRETGSFCPSRHYGRPVVHNVQQEEVILNIVEGEPTISIRRMSANVGLSRSTTSRILDEQQLRANVTNSRQLDAFESLEIIKCNTSMNKDNGPIPTSPLFALINKDSYGSVNRGNKFGINSASGDKMPPKCSFPMRLTNKTLWWQVTYWLCLGCTMIFCRVTGFDQNFFCRYREKEALQKRLSRVVTASKFSRTYVKAAYVDRIKSPEIMNSRVDGNLQKEVVRLELRFIIKHGESVTPAEMTASSHYPSNRRFTIAKRLASCPIEDGET